VNRFDGKTAIVTGTSPDIGGAFTGGLAAEGTDVAWTVAG
jgi:NAD(P)-dependent dehydrogenase (short-subunit alcohol dehydrogenase family)